MSAQGSIAEQLTALTTVDPVGSAYVQLARTEAFAAAAGAHDQHEAELAAARAALADREPPALAARRCAAALLVSDSLPAQYSPADLEHWMPPFAAAGVEAQHRDVAVKLWTEWRSAALRGDAVVDGPSPVAHLIERWERALAGIIAAVSGSTPRVVLLMDWIDFVMRDDGDLSWQALVAAVGRAGLVSTPDWPDDVCAVLPPLEVRLAQRLALAGRHLALVDNLPASPAALRDLLASLRNAPVRRLIGDRIAAQRSTSTVPVTTMP